MPAARDPADAGPIAIFDRRAVRLHRDRAAASIGEVAPILGDVAARLLDRLDDVTRRFSCALDIGGRGSTAPLLRERGIETVSCDLSARMAALNGGAVVAADEEWLPFGAACFDLVVANLSLHWVNDLPGALVQVRRALRPGGLFLASLPARGTLAELRDALTEAELALRLGAAPRVSPFLDLRDGAHLLQRAGFILPVADADAIELRYANPMQVLRDLQDAGEANALVTRERRIPPRALLPAALSVLPEDDGRVPVTLNLAMLTGWA